MDVPPAATASGRTVVHEFPLIKQPTLIMVGSRGRTATGRAFPPPELRERMGNSPKLARQVAATMPNARADVFEGYGHMLHLEATERFNRTPLEFLAEQSAPLGINRLGRRARPGRLQSSPTRVLLAMNRNMALNPSHIWRPGTQAVMLEPYPATDMVGKSGHYR